MNQPIGNLSLLLRPSLAPKDRSTDRRRLQVYRPEHRAFLFLQGPPGPLMHELATAMRGRGVKVERINICSGDKVDWPERATNFRGRYRDWPVFFDNFLREHQITDILLFGDCRPYHVSARGVAALRGVRTYVLEEGYLRPHWMTLELDGVNGHSRLTRRKDWVIEQARELPPEPYLPPVTATLRRRVRDTARHYIAVHAGRVAFPFYRTHRQGSALMEAVGWGWKYLTRGVRERQTRQVLSRLRGKSFFLVPLQLSGDYQIRSHSPFPDMRAAAAYVMESFARHAPEDAHLLIKAHPFDTTLTNWRLFLSRRSRRLGIEGRVHFIDGGQLDQLAAETAGMVCVNSTSATLALAAGRPVCTLGEAIYNVPGLTFDRHLDEFWTDPVPPEPGLYGAFRRVLVDRCLVRGGIASESAVNTLIQSMLERLGC
ncbi:MAG TPA: capsular biosynthesis protein [Sphingomicrobium sp.]|nr:capsular biosynthesis protein [Sphingomicrobium sp.]